MHLRCWHRKLGAVTGNACEVPVAEGTPLPHTAGG